LNNKGLTLTEVIVSALIIAVLAAGLFGAFLGAQRFINRAKHKAQAYNFAMEAMDRLRGYYNYSSDPQMVVAAGVWKPCSNIDMSDSDLAGKMVVKNGDVELTYCVEDTEGIEAEAYKEVTVKVHWKEPDFNE